MVLTLAGCASGETGKVTGEIKVYTRDATSGTRSAYEEAGGFKGELTKTAIEVTSNDDMAAKVGSVKEGIGYTSLSTDFEKNKVTPLQFDGVTASEATVLDGSYKLQRPFEFVTRAAGDFGSTEKEELVAAFLDYLQNSTEGMLIVEKNGGTVDKTKGKAWADLAKNHPIVGKDNSAIKINTVGSTSVEKTLKAALEAFVPEAGNFQFTMNHSGSGDGYKRVLGSEKDSANKGDIGFASRAFEANEEVSKGKLSGQYCVDAVVTVVNNQNTDLKSITKDQMKAIFTGATTKWEDIK